MEDTSEGIRKLLRDSVFLGLIGLALLFGGLLGAVSWHSWATPSHPYKAFMESDEAFNRRAEAWKAQMDERGQNAVVPMAWAIPMTIVGIGGALLCGGVIIARNDK